MLTIDRQPAPPELPQFSHDLHAALVAAATESRSVQRPARLRIYSAAAVAAVAVAVIIVVIVAVARSGGSGPGPAPGPLQLASFSVSTEPGGQVVLVLRPGQLRDPDQLRQALAKVGVPALVTADSVCYVPGPSAILNQVLGPPRHLPDRSVWTITPSAIPSGVELSIGYFHVSGGFGIHVTLVPEHGHLTCTATPPVPPHG
jgi:hypothetical protein